VLCARGTVLSRAFDCGIAGVPLPRTYTPWQHVLGQSRRPRGVTNHTGTIGLMSGKIV